MVSQQWHGNEVKVAGKRVINKSVFEVGLVVEGQAKALCAVDTGRLRASITTASSGKQSEVEPKATNADKINKPTDNMEVLVGTAVFYGPYVEFGTIRSSAQPFLRPALDLAKGRVLTITRENGRYEFKEYLK
jgi:HK97 gp10 family phage protein